MTEEMKFTQGDLDRIITERLDRQQRKFDTNLANLEEEKNKTKLLENEEYKTLIDQLTGENKQFSEQVGILTEKDAKRQKVMQGILDSKLEEYGEEAKKAVESIPGDVTVKLSWLNEFKSLFEATGDGVGSPASGKKSGGPKKSKFKVHGI